MVYAVELDGSCVKVELSDGMTAEELTLAKDFINKIIDTQIKKITAESKRRTITDVVTEESEIAMLGLSSRSYNTLKRAGINTVGKLVSYTKEDLKNVHYLGDQSLIEIIGRLADCGFTLKEAENDRTTA